MHHRRFLTAISLLLLSGVCQSAAAASYKLVDLGIGEGNAINNLGHAVGTLYAATTETHGFFYDGTNVSVLTSTNRYQYATNPATGEALYVDELLTTADGINDSDHISGSARYYAQPSHLPYLKIGKSVTHPYEDKDPFYDCARAVLNNHDVVVVTSSFYNGGGYLFHWSYAINDSNVVGGASAEIIPGSSAGAPKLAPRAALSKIGAAGILHPSLYQPASWDVQFLEPQPVPNGDILGDRGPIQHLSSVLGINNAGHAVGHRRFGLTHRAFIYKGAGIEDLQPLAGDDSSALGINSKDEVVGTAASLLGNAHAVLWRNGIPLDLNDVIPDAGGWLLVKASAINDRGDIVGSGTLKGATHAFLLSYVATDPTPAPRLSGKNYFGITVEGTVGATYRIEYRVSVSPEQWKPLTTLTLTSSSQFYLDAESAGIPQRLYRAIQLP